MTKDEVTNYLRGLGYDATNEDGVILIWTHEPMPLPEKNRLRKILQSIGYRSSWGWRLKA